MLDRNTGVTTLESTLTPALAGGHDLLLVFVQRHDGPERLVYLYLFDTRSKGACPKWAVSGTDAKATSVNRH